MQEPLLVKKQQNYKKIEPQYLKILLWKNYIVYKRNKQKLMFLILGPILVNIVIILSQLMANNAKTLDAGPNPLLKQVQQKLPNCYDLLKNVDCFSLSYGITGLHEEWVDYTIDNLKKINNFQDKDFEKAFQTDQIEAQLISPYQSYFKKNPGIAQIAIEFCTGQKLFINKEQQIPVYLNNCQDLDIQVPQLKDSVFNENYNYDDQPNKLIQNITDFNKNYIQIQYQNIIQNANQRLGFNEHNYKKRDDKDDQEEDQEEKYIYQQQFPNSFFYIIHMNMTQLIKDVENYDYQSMGIILKSQIDNILANYLKQNERKKENQELKNYINIETSQFPGFSDERIRKKINVSTELGAFWFIIIPLYIFYIILGDLVYEKEKSLRIGMNIYGVPHYKYWFSWLITSIIIALFTTVYTILIAYAFQFEIFLRTPFEMMFITYFTFIMSLISVAFFFSTIFDNSKSAFACGIAFILICFVIQMLMSTSIALSLIYQKDASSGFILTQLFLDMFSPFNYAKLYIDFKESAQTIFSHKQNKWVQQNGMTWKGIFQKREGEILNRQFERPSSAYSYLLLLLNILIFASLTIYFDNYLDSNRGIGKPWHLNLFKLKKKNLSKNNTKNQNIYLKNKKEVKISLQQIENSKQNLQEEKQIEIIEDPIILNSDIIQDQNIGIQVNNVCKTFVKKNLFYECSTRRNKEKKIKITKALKNVNIDIYNDQICGFLGHSGAGKTTLINILTGMINYNDGNILINDVELNQDNMNQLRKKMGFCPQFDVIWDQLTPREHIQFFCKIKGINEQQEIDQIIEEKLQMVSLQKVENGQAGGFSGGMKRRLSLVISTIGDPDVLFLDEPTNAMDPISKREAWKMIQNCKQNRCVLLTTHSMEEADILSDKIVILSQGQVLCQGSNQYLKQQYSKGNRFYLITKKNTNNEEVISKIELEFDIEIEDYSGNSLIFCVRNKIQQQKLFIFLDENENNSNLNENQQFLKSVIDDWGFSNATIEDVFLKVTKGHRNSKLCFSNQHSNLLNSKIKS